MTIDIKNILVFKTNISSATQLLPVAKVLDDHAGISGWSIDMEDADCVLRVTTTLLQPGEIIKIISMHGFACAELS